MWVDPLRQIGDKYHLVAGSTYPSEIYDGVSEFVSWDDDDMDDIPYEIPTWTIYYSHKK